MRLKNAPPAYFISQNQPRCTVYTRNAAGNLATALRRRKAKPLPFPPGTGDPTGLQKSAALNRQWHSWLYKMWRDTLTNTQRTGWESAAPSFTITNFEGARKTPNGFQLFVWWNSYSTNASWDPPTPWSPGNYTADLNAPTHYAPPVISNLQLTDSTPPTFTLAFDCDQDATLYTARAILTPPVLPGVTPKNSAWRRLGMTNVTPPPAPFDAAYPFNVAYPPWDVNTTGYNPAFWQVRGLRLLFTACTSRQILDTGTNALTYVASSLFHMQHQIFVADHMVWDLDPADGSHRTLSSCYYDPNTGLPFGNGNDWLFVGYATGWYAAVTRISDPIEVQAADINATWATTITRTATTDTVNTYGHILTLANERPSLKTDCGISGFPGQCTIENYTVTWTNAHYQAQFNYTGIIENPAAHGPRNARLVLQSGAPQPHIHSAPAPLVVNL